MPGENSGSNANGDVDDDEDRALRIEASRIARTFTCPATPACMLPPSQLPRPVLRRAHAYRYRRMQQFTCLTCGRVSILPVYA